MLELIWHLSYMSVLVFVLGYFLHYHAFKHGLADDNDKVKTDALKKGPDGEEKDYLNLIYDGKSWHITDKVAQYVDRD